MLGLRIEWSKSYARLKRWREEILLLQEEMRRTVVSLHWEADQWEAKTRIDTFDGERLEGCSAYAHEQAQIRRNLATRFEQDWNDRFARTARDFDPGRLDLTAIDESMDYEMENTSKGDDESDVDMVEDEEISLPNNNEDEDEEAEEDEPEDEAEGLLQDEDNEEDKEGDRDDGLAMESLTLKEMLNALEEAQE
jgi:hypothetical protein